jgi:hypothetical protein
MRMKLGTRIAIGVIVAGLVEAGLMLWLVPTNPSWQGSWAMFHIPLSVMATYSWLYIGGAVLFLMSLGVYRAKLRRAYIIIASGIILSAIGAAQAPIITGFDLWESWWAVSGAYGWAFILGSTVMYIGVCSFARLVSAKTVFARAMFVFPAAAGISALSALLPHVVTPTPETTYDAANAIVLFSALTYLAAGLAINAIRQHAGVHYANALGWLAAGSVLGFFALLMTMLDSLILDSAPDMWRLATNLLVLLASLVLLRAGYSFYETREY